MKTGNPDRRPKLVKDGYNAYLTPFLTALIGEVGNVNFDDAPAEKRKRGRGRPGKERVQFDPLYIPFKSMPNANRNRENDLSVSGALRGLMADYPNLPDKEGSLAAWINAIADAVEKHDAMKAGYYAYHALRHAILTTHFSMLDDGDGNKATLVSLAHEGHLARKANKRRGATLKIRRG